MGCERVAAVVSGADPVVFRFLVDEQPFVVTLIPDDAPGFGLTPRETGRLKRLAPGSTGLAMWRALEVLDAEVLAALCVIAVERSGQVIDADALFDDKIKWRLDADEADPADPPIVAADDAAAAVA